MMNPHWELDWKQPFSHHRCSLLIVDMQDIVNSASETSFFVTVSLRYRFQKILTCFIVQFNEL